MVSALGVESPRPQTSRWHPHGELFGRCLPLANQSRHGLGECLAFGGKDPCGERFGGILLVDRYVPPQDDLAVIVFVVDVMHGATGDPGAGSQNGFVHPHAVEASAAEGG